MIKRLELPVTERPVSHFFTVNQGHVDLHFHQKLAYLSPEGKSKTELSVFALEFGDDS